MFIDLLKSHLKQYSKYAYEDIYKFIFQGVFAGGHLIDNESSHLARLKEELKSVESRPLKPLEQLSNNYFRVYLDGLIKTPLSIDTLAKMIVVSAHENKGDLKLFVSHLNTWQAIEGNKKVAMFIKEMKSRDYPLVHHSQIYRQTYHPAYRIISKKYAFYFELFKSIDEKLKQKKHVVVAIDGDAGSGKSGLATLINNIYQNDTIQMDDFFLQQKQRTPLRLQEVGGHIDYERFIKQVINPLKTQTPIVYRPYNCQTHAFDDIKMFKHTSLMVIEGSYSMRTEFLDVYDIKVCLNVDKKTQYKRLKKRNNAHLFKQFIEVWIPKEQAYAKAFNIKNNADFIFDTSEETQDK